MDSLLLVGEKPTCNDIAKWRPFRTVLNYYFLSSYSVNMYVGCFRCCLKEICSQCNCTRKSEGNVYVVDTKKIKSVIYNEDLFSDQASLALPILKHLRFY